MTDSPTPPSQPKRQIDWFPILIITFTLFCCFLSCILLTASNPAFWENIPLPRRGPDMPEVRLEEILTTTRQHTILIRNLSPDLVL